MIQAHPSAVAAPLMDDDRALIHVDLASPIFFETIGQTVLKLAMPAYQGGITDGSVDSQMPFASQDALVAMQRLVELINSLRSAVLSPQGESQPNQWHFDLPLTPQNLLPYVSEEAYEVLDALQRETSETLPLSQTPSPSPSSSLVAIEVLIPYLLWDIARSSYTVMQLIEGINAQHGRSNEAWTSGMARLVIMLRVKTPKTQWCFDVVTGRSPDSLLDGDSILRSDDNLLPLWQPASASPHQGDRVDNQLQELQRQLQATSPVLKRFMEGMDVDLLIPKQEWQVGEIQLELGFEFISRASEFTACNPSFDRMDLVEAELLEDSALSETFSEGFTHLAPVAQVSVVELPRQSLGIATLIRLADQSESELYIQRLLQQQIRRAIAQLQKNLQNNGSVTDADEQLLQVVNEAYETAHQVCVAAGSPLYSQQPILLLDELIPHLLWSITRSSHEVMQLIGGIKGAVFEPGCDWEQGTLRLLAMLQFQAIGVNWMIDLATGRAIAPTISFLNPKAVCQAFAFPEVFPHFSFSLLLRHAIQAEKLLANIQQHIQETTSEIGRLMNITTVEWLEDGHDWEQGTLTLIFGLEFLPICL